MKKLLFILIISWSLFSLKAQVENCPSDVNFNEWTINGKPDGQEWLIAMDGHKAKQLLHNNDSPAFLVSPFTFYNAKMSGYIKVDEENLDDDHIGFAFGYKDPNGAPYDVYKTLIFDWKEAPQDFGHCRFGCKEGFALYEVDGQISFGDSTNFYFAAHRQGNNKFIVLDSLYGESLGWVPEQTHFVEIIYQPKRIRIIIDGVEIFNVEGCFPQGFFGLYVYSQQDVAFRNFKYEPYYELENELGFCLGDTSHFLLEDIECQDQQPPHNIVSANWTFGDENDPTNPLGTILFEAENVYEEQGNYFPNVVIENDLGCITNMPTTIQINDPEQIASDTSIQILIGDVISIPLQQDIEFTFVPDTFLQCHSCESIKIYPTTDIEFEVFTKDELNCEAHHKIVIDVIEELSVFVPTAFSPNNDGLNDFVEIFTNESVASLVKLEIYDQWGTMLYQKATIDPMYSGYLWDGYHNGKPMSNDVFVYQLEVEYINGQTKILKGDISLIK